MLVHSSSSYIQVFPRGLLFYAFGNTYRYLLLPLLRAPAASTTAAGGSAAAAETGKISWYGE
jgi:hypothetical protein